jgi:hypothetical protein
MHVRLFVLELLLLALAAPVAIAAEPEGGWIKDAKGCKIFNPSPKPGEAIKWSGPCKEGFAEGKGVLEYAADGKPGARYEGTLKRGKFHGRGELKTADGAVYDGDWVEGTQDGYGEYTAPDKTSFKGGWTGGKPDGPGVLTTPDGQVVKGIWAKGEYLTPYQDDKAGMKPKAQEPGAKSEPGAKKVKPGSTKKED